MTADEFEKAAELARLARLLGVDEQELQMCAAVPPEALRQFRHAVTDRLFAGDGDKLARIAAAAKLVPAPIAAKAAAKAFGPTLTAAIATTIDPARGIAVAGSLPVGFLAQVAIAIDPRRAGDILAQTPPRLAADVAARLMSMGEHLTLGRFVGAIGDDALTAAVAQLSDADLLRVACNIENPDELDRVIDVVAARLPGVVAAAAQEKLWLPTFRLLDSVSDEHKTTLGALIAQLSDDDVAEVSEAAKQAGCWSEIEPYLAVGGS